MYELADSEWERNNALRRNTERLKALMSAFERAGFPEKIINVRGENDYIHFPWQNIMIGIWFCHSEYVAAGKLFVCRLPPEGKLLRLHELVHARRELLRYTDNPPPGDIAAELAAGYAYFETQVSQSVSETEWADEFARRVARLVTVYQDSLPSISCAQ